MVRACDADAQRPQSLICQQQRHFFLNVMIDIALPVSVFFATYAKTLVT